MKVLIQRVKRASVTIDNEIYSSINKGILARIHLNEESIKATEKQLKKYY